MNKSDLKIIEGCLNNPNYKMDLEKPPQKCKFCGEKMKKLDEDILAKMGESLCKEMGEYTCSCQGFVDYITTVVEEKKLNLYIMQKKAEIKKQREQLLLNSAFYKDVVKFRPYKEAMEKVINEPNLDRDLQDSVENYFKVSYDYHIKSEDMMGYYFWPVL